MAWRKNGERDAEIWHDYVGGMRLVALAKKYELSPARISNIVGVQRQRVPKREKVELREELVEQLNWLRSQAQLIAELPPAPAYRGDKPIFELDEWGEPDPTRPVMDHTGRLSAMRSIIDAHGRLAKMLGLDEPESVRIEGDQTVRYEIVGVDPEALK